jgi:hypothetical protein
MVQAPEYSWLTGIQVGLVMAWLDFPAVRKTWVTEWLIPGISAFLVGAASWGALDYFGKDPSDNIFGVFASALFTALFLYRVADPPAPTSPRANSVDLDLS